MGVIMRVLKYAILGLLDKQEMSGYDIMNQFNHNMVHFWSAKHSQIYPELKKLTQEGLIEFRSVSQGNKVLDKKIYSITSKGKQELQQWLDKLMPLPDTVKDEFMLKAYFVSSMSKEEVKRQFTNQLRNLQDKINFLEGRLRELYEEVGENIVSSSPYFGLYLVLTRAISRDKNYFNWVQDVLNQIDAEK